MWRCSISETRESVELDELVPVGREDEGDVQSLAMGIALGLVEPMPRWERVLFRFNERHSDRLCVRMDLHAEHVVDLAPRAAAGLGGDDFDAAGGFLTANQILRPATSVDGRVDELRSRVRLAH